MRKKTMAEKTEMKVIALLLEEAINNGLETEVVYTALKTMQEDNTLSPAQALQEGMNEWIN